MTGGGEELRCAVVQAEEAEKKQPERVSLRRQPPGEVEANQQLGSCCLTFELTPTAEAGGVSPVTDDDTNSGRRAYDA